MAIDYEMRRFRITTGTTPTTQAFGAVFADGRAIWREYLSSGDKTTMPFTGKISDLTAVYGGQSGYSLSYTDPDEPTFVSVSPATGSAAGGTSFTITGTNLNSASVSVTIGGVAATTVRSNATTITAVSPAGGAGTEDIVITTAEGSVTAADAWTYT